MVSVTVRLLRSATPSSSASNNSGSGLITSLKGNFGRLWRCGHETFGNDQRQIISVKGSGATTYLQSLVTSDLLSPPIPPREEEESTTDGRPSEEANLIDHDQPMVEFSEKLRSTCFLDNKGRIVTDSLLWKLDDGHYLIDVPGGTHTAEYLLGHLKQFVLRKTKVKVKMETNMSSHVIYGTLNASKTPPGYIASVDPRHPSLGMRMISLEKPDSENLNLMPLMSSQFPEAPGTYEVLRKLAGVAEGSELRNKIAIESNQEFLNAVSFTKGCYLGQELTARVQYTGNVRKRIMPIFLTDTNLQIPPPWLIASQIQQQQAADNNEDEDSENATAAAAAASSAGGPRLPRLSPSAAGAIMGMMSGDITAEVDPTNVQQQQQTTTNQQQSPDRSQLRAQADILLETLQSTIKVGDKIQDTKDGKTIGQIIATPADGTNVVLAQMRLDRVGLLGNGVWNHTNKITIGGGSGKNKVSNDGEDDKDDKNKKRQQQFRYLPYLPLWWPEIDRSSGKAIE